MAFCGGEAMTLTIARGFAALKLQELELVNAYGPTEASISCCMGTVNYRAKDPELCSIGSALPNYEVSIVDEHGCPLPAEWTEEIRIQGAGVSPGYIHSPKQAQSSKSHDTLVEELREKLYDWRYVQNDQGGQFPIHGTYRFRLLPKDPW
jgi:acyl-CoA synthetase (AMP-forming)/AMP-acid ligase II